MDKKEPMGSRIGEVQRDIVENLRNELKVPKYRIYEAAVEIFNAFDTEFQLFLISGNPELRERVFEIVRRLPLPPQPKKVDKHKK